MKASKQIYRAVNASVAEKRFISADEAMPDGWFASSREAVAAFNPADEGTSEAAETKPRVRRGKPADEGTSEAAETKPRVRRGKPADEGTSE
jgi:hypothetical protein